MEAGTGVTLGTRSTFAYGRDLPFTRFFGSGRSQIKIMHSTYRLPYGPGAMNEYEYEVQDMRENGGF
jgi:hypothetical protein